MVSFTYDDFPQIMSGAKTVTWRLWKYAHVKAGKSYSLGEGSIYIVDVRLVPAADITDDDARQAGRASARALVEFAAAHTGAAVTPETRLYRVQFRYSPEPVARRVYSLPEVEAKLKHLDAASPQGPWTEAVLRLIEQNPGVVARRLAADLGQPAQDFKASVRKLKALGLTNSLLVGYELTELGLTYLDTLDGAEPEEDN